MIKNSIKFILQKILGLKNYLFLFSLFMIKKLVWDKRERAFIKFIELVKNEGNVIDIGANIGVMTYHFARKLPDTTVHSFEPVPVNYNNLLTIKQKFKLNNVILYNCALGDKNREEQIIMPCLSGVYFPGLSHIVKGNMQEKGNKYSVQVKRLDEIDGFLKMPVTAIKLDVENYEYEVLYGAEKIISKNRPLIYCELWEGENRQKSIDVLYKHNYSVFVWQCNKLVLFDGKSREQNFFFIPVERTGELK
ncbi:MAG: hypothetical protein A2X13_02745 [Bacteroidetes bacterium GWC2_33_15]|nr:MAG: hypothetical protein A2X10_05265 [Bacteroidetes bacterium GWA2_33_15]OFX49405.1 MAG: hypothetical protein A2X13_02745 [Bacteroidetes bacterium GWC2_33_15]OFX63002.1 MAG: hypothetical protein A2X15_10130 [Bacteroidetes bacterium GWB2_32_14]OFX68753.1 MAG: hypothetical protein A2X14_14270 [Bacteroidetes bacterium GWD2_33_33]HAN19072.1 hypothetical protein [Bacteroidales bacterium]